MRALVLLTCAWLSGCAVFVSPLGVLAGKPYMATAFDLELIEGGGSSSPGLMVFDAPGLGWIDLPFALALDTALLPLAGLSWASQELDRWLTENVGQPDEERERDWE